MAYVESFYLEPTADVYNESVEVQQIPSVQHILEQEIVTTKPSPVSDYCGFESDEIPPIYRAQLRDVQKKKILAAENADKSMYAYGVEEDVVKKEETMVNEEKEEVKNMAPITGPQSVEYYVPGFSPPPQNDGDSEVQKRADFSLPKMKAIEATENVFNITGKHEASQYILMENEDPKNVMTKSVMESLISYTDVASTASADSCLTATLGPAYGYLPTVNTHRQTDEKYKGLSAFRPVTQSVQSQYASLELN